MTKKLVAYFSASGITSQVSKMLASVANADLFEIEPSIPYTSADLNWMDKKARSTIEMNNPSSRPEIAKKLDNMNMYDVIFLGFPIWWYTAPTIINTFLEQYDMSNKKIILFATSGGSGFGKTLQSLKKSVDDSTMIQEGKILNNISIESLANWINSLDI